MQENTLRYEDVKILELERIIEDFKQKFTTRTEGVESFLTITEIELMWSELQDKTNKIYADMILELMRGANETALIHKKKETTEPGEFP